MTSEFLCCAIAQLTLHYMVCFLVPAACAVLLVREGGPQLPVTQPLSHTHTSLASLRATGGLTAGVSSFEYDMLSTTICIFQAHVELCYLGICGCALPPHQQHTALMWHYVFT